MHGVAVQPAVDLQVGEGLGAMGNPYNAGGLLIAGIPWRHAMS
jgi:hypothetical protein